MGRKAYNDSIAPNHPFFLRNGIRLIFYTVPTKSHFIEQTFGKVTTEAFHAIIDPMITELTPLVNYLWKYYTDRSLTKLE